MILKKEINKMKQRKELISDETLIRERRILTVQSKILAALKRLTPEKRPRVIRAVAEIYGYSTD